jgi:hypothetical protein
MRLAALLQIPLMILLGSPELRRRLDLRDNGAIEPAALLQFLFRGFGCDLLLG